MRLLVCGDRKWRDRDYLYTILNDLRLFYDVSVVIEGEAAGADRMAGEWAVERGIPVERYPADWNRDGKPAGIIRNVQMLKEGKPEMVVAFHRSFRESKGTRHMVTIAREAGIQCHIFPHRTTDVQKIAEDGEWWLDILKSGAFL